MSYLFPCVVLKSYDDVRNSIVRRYDIQDQLLFETKNFHINR